MKNLALTVLTLVIVVLAVHSPCFGEQLPTPKIEVVFPGVTRVVYADQTFVFTTTVRLSATFEFMPPGEIRIKVRTSAAPFGGMAPAGQRLRIYWQEGDETLYDGDPPEDEWIGGVLTEGGLTEK